MSLTFPEANTDACETQEAWDRAERAEDLTAIGLLERARERLAQPERLLRGDFAAQLQADGRHLSLDPDDPRVECWCLVGSFGFGAATLYPARNAALMFVLRAHSILVGGAIWGWPALSKWSDDPRTPWKVVLAVIDRALDLARAESEAAHA